MLAPERTREALPTGPRRPPGRLLFGAALVAALLPFVVSGVDVVVDAGTGYHPTADLAAIELQTRDVGRHAVLVGPYSREGFHHPGPALYYVLALPYHLSDSNSVGLLLGALAINGLAVVGMALVARRLGGLTLALCTLVLVGLLVRALGPNFLRDPWNPYVTVLPLGLLVFLSWAMHHGEAWTPAAAAAVASFLVQSHLGYALVALGLLAWGGAGWLRAVLRDGDPLRGSRRRRLAPAGLATVAVLGVMWLPPLIDVATRSPDNVQRIGDYLGDPHDLHNLKESYRVVTDQLSARPEWLAGPERPALTGEVAALYRPAPVPILLVAFAGAVVLLWRRRARAGLLLAGTVAVGLVLEVVSVWRLAGPVLTYLVRWGWVLGMATGLVVLWTAVLLLPPRWRRPTGLPVLVAVAALAVVSVLNSVVAARAQPPYRHQSDVAAPLSRSVLASLPAGRRPVLLSGSSGISAFHEAGIAVQLERHGVPVRADHTRYGEHRVYEGEPVRAVLTVATEDAIDRLLAQRDTRLVAHNFTLAERSQIKRRIKELEAMHRSGKLTSDAFLDTVERQLRALGDHVAVFRIGLTPSR
jgi:hypothetical protein